MGTEYLIGLDLGREVDHSAWAAIEKRKFYWHDGLKEYVDDPDNYADFIIDYHKTRQELGLIGLSQIPLHTPWETVAQELDGVITRCNERTKGAEIEIWIDCTGIGAPVLEGFIEPAVYKHRNCRMCPVKITSGEQGYDVSAETVSKIHLIDTAMVMREKGELVIAKELQNTPIMDLFEKQIQDFRRKEGKRAGTIRYEAEVGHDDLVVAFALACLGAAEEGRVRIWSL